MNWASKLGLGTVQWGMVYGVANRKGQTRFTEVCDILRAAKQNGVIFLDTAYAYGEAERVLGEQEEVITQGFRVVTKTLPLNIHEVSDDDVGKISMAFIESLHRLQCRQVYGLLVHNPNILLTPGGHLLWTALKEFKVMGLVQKIGVSVYQPRQLEIILDSYQIDLVQLPLNVFDQRFSQTGLLKRLKQERIEVHTRSALLQGLLLMSSNELPAHFASIRDHHARLHKSFRRTGLTPLQGCLLYCLAEFEVDRVIVGCDTLEQFGTLTNEVLSLANDVIVPELSEFALTDEAILNPSIWPK